MKKRIFCILLFTLFFLFSAIGVNAEGESTYVITQNEDTFSLYKTDGDGELVGSSSDLSLLLSLTEGGRVTLDGLRIDSDVTLDNGDYYISGEASFSRIFTVGANARITLDGAVFSFDGGQSLLRIKGGEVTMLSGRVVSDVCSAVLLDYSARASLEIYSGELYSKAKAALLINSGSAEIYGGKISSQTDCAIENFSTLTVSGSPDISSEKYSVITDKPIAISSTSGELSSPISVKYLSEFKKGSKTEVLRHASTGSLSQVTLYDMNGDEAEVRYFDYDEKTGERSFGAVYRPYTARTFHSGELIGRVEFLYADELLTLLAPEKRGYNFVGWFTDEGLTAPLVSSAAGLSDIDIYASYKLKAPEFSISSMSFTYDGSTQYLNFDTLTHELRDFGRFELEWFKNGVSIGSFDGGVKLKNASDSGEYFCRITFFHETESVSITTPTVSATVEKMKVALPICESVKYTGKPQSSSVGETALYTVSEAYGVTVGKYPLTLTLKSPENYEFEGVSEPSVTLFFEITMAENAWLDEPRAFDFYEGQSPDFSAYPLFGEVYYLFSDSADGVYTPTCPTSPGVYYAVARVDGTENFGALSSSAKSFRVLEEYAVGISVKSPPSVTEYEAFSAFDPDGLLIEVLYNSQRREIISHADIAVSYQSADSIRYGDSGVTVSYGGCGVMIPITVKKCKYDLSSLVFEGASFVYDGMAHTLNYSGTLPVGKDGIPLSATVSTSAVNVGLYSVSLSFYSESKNYALPEPIVAYLEIIPLVCEVSWGECEFIYDGTPKLPTAEFTDAQGRVVQLAPSGAVIGATESAIAEVTPPEKNYVFSNPTQSFTVNKADYDLSGITWESDSFVYDGCEHINILRGLPEGVYVIGYINNKGTNAGKYLSSAVVYYDEANYNPPPEIVFAWEILPSVYDTSSFRFDDTAVVFDGEYHYPDLRGEMPIGRDGIALKYEFSCGALHVSDGRVEVSVSFSTDSENYLPPEPVTAFVRIVPMPIEVEWEYLGGIYNGKAHLPVAKSELCAVSVLGEGINVGYYTATAIPDSPDFEITNPTYNYYVSPAENHWLKSIKADDIFFGDDPTPQALAYAGSAVFRYFADEKCTSEVTFPLSVGEYYVRAEVRGLENYLDLVSEVVPFSVIAVAVTDIEVVLNVDTPRAFYRLNENDLEIFAVYNNGEKEPISFENVNIYYQNADSLRINDEYFTLFYGGDTVKIPISVEKALMDISEFEWEYAEVVYDGALKYPILKNLPEGVTVAEYEGGGINAGVYTVRAVLEYDEDNYEPPPVIECSFTVKKQSVKLPMLLPITYDASEHIPVSESELYTFDRIGYVNAGKYTVYAELSDPENYIFENGDSMVAVSLVIEKRVINASVRPITVYRDTDPHMPPYELSGEVFSGDELKLYYEIENGRVYIRCANPNYEIISDGAEVIFKSTYSRDTAENIAICVMLAIALIAALTVIFFSRERLLHKISAARCKRHFKKEQYAPPTLIAENPEPPREIIPPTPTIEAPGETETSDIMSVDIERADALITDSLARSLVRCEGAEIVTSGKRRYAINVDTLSDNFTDGERVDVNSLKNRNLIARDTGYLKVLARGSIDKKLHVYANAFSLSAVKMIALTGGTAVKVGKARKSEEKNETFDKES